MTALQSYAEAALEDRCAPRTPIYVSAALRMSGGHGFAVLVTDLSLAGFACEMMTGMRPGTICWLTLPGLGALESRMVWNDGSKIGCEFQTLLNQAVFDWIVERHAAQIATASEHHQPAPAEAVAADIDTAPAISGHDLRRRLRAVR